MMKLRQTEPQGCALCESDGKEAAALYELRQDMFQLMTAVEDAGYKVLVDRLGKVELVRPAR